MAAITAKLATKTNGKTTATASATGPFLTWFDGKLVPPEQAQVSVLSHALHYGTSTFEGIRCYETPKGPAIFRLKEHIKRLFYSAGFLGFKVPFTPQELEKACLDTVRANGFSSCYVRPLIFYGAGGLSFKFDNNQTHVIVATYPLGPFLGANSQTEGVRIKTASWRKTPGTSVPSSAKLGGNYVNAMLAYQEIRRQGYDEAILLRENGMVAEGAGCNIFLIRNGELYTPASSEDNLPGITRDSILTIAKGLGIPVHEQSISRGNLIEADEVFLSGTAVEVTPVREVDDRIIADGKPGPITRKLQEAFFAAARGKDPRYNAWVVPVGSK
jgi:branched-chain amino acid aminotransferase